MKNIKGNPPPPPSPARQAVMHKCFLVTPQALRDAGFPVSRTVQRVGEMILTAPGAFHFG